MLSLDIWGYISEFIDNDKEKCKLMMTCKEISQCKFYFYEPIHINKIVKSKWYVHHVNLIVSDKKYVSHSSITHLTFDDNFDECLNKYVSNSVTHFKIH